MGYVFEPELKLGCSKSERNLAEKERLSLCQELQSHSARAEGNYFGLAKMAPSSSDLPWVVAASVLLGGMWPVEGKPGWMTAVLFIFDQKKSRSFQEELKRENLL